MTLDRDIERQLSWICQCSVCQNVARAQLERQRVAREWADPDTWYAAEVARMAERSPA